MPERGLRKAEATPLATLSSVFGHRAFRGVQGDAVGAAMAGRDSLVVMPTGGGKSACYQVPALCMPGLTVVVSPLLALMRDQVDALRSKGVRAAALASERAMGDAERRSVEAALGRGTLDILYVSPERFASRSFARSIRDARVSMVAVDEAHCVCEWGLDFRSDYLAVGEVLESSFPSSVRMALTASAGPSARDAICARLLRGDALRLVAGFARPNISLSVQASRDPLGACVDAVPRDGSPTIVYCRARRDADEVARRLGEAGSSARPYHAGMGDADRNRVQDGFLAGTVDVVAATSAFGMGIDKPDVRTVLHAGLPSSLESLYQESGRAGRDGRPADAVLFWSAKDVPRRTALASGLDADAMLREVARLEQALSYVEAPGCRTNVLLRRFGELPSSPCGRCDACLRPPSASDAGAEAHALLSILRRLGEVALGVACETLAGSATERVEAQGLHRLPEFGLMRGRGSAYARRMARQMTGAGLVEVDDVTARLRATAAGLACASCRGPVPLPVAARERARGPSTSGIPEGRVAAWRELVAARDDYARSEGLVPRHVVCDADIVRIVSGAAAKGPTDQRFMASVTRVLDALSPPARPAAVETNLF